VTRLRRLLVVEPTETATAVLARALQIARHFNAHVDLLVCARPDRLSAGRRFIKGLVASVAAPDIPIDPQVLTGISTADIIATRHREQPADLVIKYPSQGDSASRQMWSSADWQLLEACRCDVLLTRGAPWHPVPRFAAAIDVPADGPGSPQHAVFEALRGLALRYDASVEIIGSAPVTPLASAAADDGIDLLALGADARGQTWRERLSNPCGNAAFAVDCDLLIVNRAA